MFNKLKILSKMKKIKLFALAAFAMLSTNVFADSGKSATKVFTYDWEDATATITGFVSDLDAEFKAAVAIPEVVTHPTLKVDGEPRKFLVTKIAANAFKGEPVETISFPAAVAEDEYNGIEEIGAGAFAGTKIKELDLSKTIIKKVENLFGTLIASEAKDDIVNATLTSVKLPKTVEEIAANAFPNCTKLSVFDMTKATKLAKLGAGAFAGCPIKNFDLSNNEKITSLNAKTLYDGTRFMSASKTETVTLHKAFTNLNNNLQGAATLTSVTGHIYTSPSKKETTALTVLNENEFKGCAALTTFDTHSIVTFAKGCFDGCAALAEVSLAKATTVGERAFAGTASLESVSFPATGLTAIGKQAFFECASLTTATLAVDPGTQKTAITTIGEQAFAYTGITSFTIPAKNANFVVDSKAFAGTPIKTFTWMAEAYDGKTTGQLIKDDIFSKCSKVTFATKQGLIDGWRALGGTHAVSGACYNGPTNSTFSTEVADPNIPFTTTAYSTNPNKFYVKWFGKKTSEDPYTAIKVKKSECKVYAGFIEGDKSLGLIQFKADKDGDVYIVNEDAVIIVTDKEDLTYQKVYDATPDNTSWMKTKSDSYKSSQVLTNDNTNALKYCEAATTRGTLENQLTDDSYYIYGWMKAGAFQKIATGTNIPAGTLFAFAKAPVGGRMTIKWYDENGNLEGETTAIDEIPTAGAEVEGKRYNLAGQKVNAAYKGVVIKDGKKMIQK
jgi:hypothetical protein